MAKLWISEAWEFLAKKFTNAISMIPTVEGSNYSHAHPDGFLVGNAHTGEECNEGWRQILLPVSSNLSQNSRDLPPHYEDSR